MQIVLTTAGLSPEFGGPSYSIPALADYLASEVKVDLVTCKALRGHNPPALPSQIVRVTLLPVKARRQMCRASRNEFFKAVCKLVGEAETVIHDNGLWLPANHAVATAAKALKIPLLISPRGMLSSWALTHHSWKKRFAWKAFQRRDLFTATALHVTSKQELDDVRRMGFQGPIATVPNGVELPARSESEVGERQTRIALCITRLHPVKGLMSLITAWSQVRPNGWRMVIAGTDENQYLAELQAAVASLGLGREFTFLGAVAGAGKEKLYREADLFILPSYSENFGISIAEGLAHALPVITTQATPWRELITCQCGWWVEIGSMPLAHALREATLLDDCTLRAMGERGRALVATQYSWSRIAKMMKSVYDWMIAPSSPRPSVVDVYASDIPV